MKEQLKAEELLAPFAALRDAVVGLDSTAESFDALRDAVEGVYGTAGSDDAQDCFDGEIGA